MSWEKWIFCYFNKFSNSSREEWMCGRVESDLLFSWWVFINWNVSRRIIGWGVNCLFNLFNYCGLFCAANQGMERRVLFRMRFWVREWTTLYPSSGYTPGAGYLWLYHNITNRVYRATDPWFENVQEVSLKLSNHQANSASIHTLWTASIYKIWKTIINHLKSIHTLYIVRHYIKHFFHNFHSCTARFSFHLYWTF